MTPSEFDWVFVARGVLAATNLSYLLDLNIHITPHSILNVIQVESVKRRALLGCADFTGLRLSTYTVDTPIEFSIVHRTNLIFYS